MRIAHAIVTGGSSGIGLALTRRLAARGVRVSVLALDDAAMQALHDLAAELGTLHLEAVDVADREAVNAAVGRCLEVHGPVDLLVTSAGVTRPGHFLDLEDEEFERQLAVNYLGTLWAVRAVAAGMVERRRGSIVAVSSFAGLVGVFGYTAYAPSKFAVRGLIETLRCELAPHGVHVAAVYPTDVDTPMLAGEQPLKPAQTRALSGTAATLTPDAVADAILRGVARGEHRIFCDRSSWWLDRVAAVLPGLTRRIVDRTVAGAGGADGLP